MPPADKKQIERDELEADLAEGYKLRADEHREWAERVAPLYKEAFSGR